MMNNQSEKVIKNLLNENDMINHKLNTALSILKSVQENSSSNMASPASTDNKKSQNNLQLVNILLAKLAQLDHTNTNRAELLRQVSLSHLTAETRKQPRSRTLNELVAEEALEQFEWAKTASTEHRLESSCESPVSTLDRLETLIKEIKKNRIAKFGRLYQPDSLNSSDLMLNVCNRCKGEIKTV